MGIGEKSYGWVDEETRLPFHAVSGKIDTVMMNSGMVPASHVPSPMPRLPPLLSAAVCAAAALSAAAIAAPLAPLVLTPSDLQGYEWIRDPTPAKVAALRAAGKRPFVEDVSFAEEAVAFTNWAEHASAVAFAQLPRRHLMHTWKLLGVKTLQTVRFQPEGSADRFRREASFLAFQGGADGIWLPDADRLPPSWRQTLAEAREDWRILLYLRSLAEEIARHPDDGLRIEARRVAYWFSWMPAGWENCDVLRLECVGYAKRLEQLLGLPEADLPVRRSEAVEPQVLPFMPYADWAEKPVQKQMKKLGETLRFDGGLSFRADTQGFTLTWSTTNGPPLGKWQQPGGTLDFRLYVSTDEPGVFLPYRFHCDFNPTHYSIVRAPATGRNHYLFGTDERFRPFSIAYAVHNPRVWAWPRLRDFGPEYPNPRPSLRVEGNSRGGWKATLTCHWLYLYGHWPMQKAGRGDLWFVGIDRSPDTGLPVAGRVLWPRGHADYYRRFAERMATGAITDLYKEELDRTRTVWTTAEAERLYPFAKTAKPTFHRYDLESDGMFFGRLVLPLLDANENAWQLIWTDKEHSKPKFVQQPDRVKMLIWKNLGRMLFLSHEVGNRRLDYLEGRYAGVEPPEYTPKESPDANMPAEPDADYDPDMIQLDDKEF